MRAIFDINVVLDVLLQREPHHFTSSKVLTLADRNEISGHFCAASVDNTLYVLERELEKSVARRAIHTLLDILRICPVNETTIRSALNLQWPDMEDAILYESARAAGLDTVITRDAKDFMRGKLRVLTPTEVIIQQKNRF